MCCSCLPSQQLASRLPGYQFLTLASSPWPFGSFSWLWLVLLLIPHIQHENNSTYLLPMLLLNVRPTVRPPTDRPIAQTVKQYRKYQARHQMSSKAPTVRQCPRCQARPQMSQRWAYVRPGTHGPRAHGLLASTYEGPWGQSPWDLGFKYEGSMGA